MCPSRFFRPKPWTSLVFDPSSSSRGLRMAKSQTPKRWWSWWNLFPARQRSTLSGAQELSETSKKKSIHLMISAPDFCRILEIFDDICSMKPFESCCVISMKPLFWISEAEKWIDRLLLWRNEHPFHAPIYGYSARDSKSFESPFEYLWIFNEFDPSLDPSLWNHDMKKMIESNTPGQLQQLWGGFWIRRFPRFGWRRCRAWPRGGGVCAGGSRIGTDTWAVVGPPKTDLLRRISLLLFPCEFGDDVQWCPCFPWWMTMDEYNFEGEKIVEHPESQFRDARTHFLHAQTKDSHSAADKSHATWLQRC